MPITGVVAVGTCPRRRKRGKMKRYSFAGLLCATLRRLNGFV
jgi:hypothetical protein